MLSLTANCCNPKLQFAPRLPEKSKDGNGNRITASRGIGQQRPCSLALTHDVTLPSPSKAPGFL